MTVDQLKEIIRGEGAKRGAMTEVEARIGKLQTELAPLVAHRGKIAADLERIDKAKTELAATANKPAAK